jgi:histone-lysine N-methyltransferase SETD3
VEAAAPSPVSGQEQQNRIDKLQQWLQQQGNLPQYILESKRFRADDGERVGFIASRDVQEGTVVLQIPEAAAITSIDAEKHEVVGQVAANCSELVALSLWLMAERAKGSSSNWAPLLATLPETTNSPILWDDQQRAELLTGSPTLLEARKRHDTLLQQWADLSQQLAAAGPAAFPPEVFNEANFMRCFCVVLASAVYLPSAECFALLPLAGLLGRTGNDNGCNLDYDAAQGAVVVTAGRPYR